MDEYECPYCGRTFDYMKVYKAHKDTCGLKKLNEFDNREGIESLTGLEKRLDALRHNEYDEQNDTTKYVQKNLKNQPVRR